MAKDKGDIEDDYFYRQDQEKIAKLKEEAAAKKLAEEAEALKKLHWNHCGKCGTSMDTKVFKGVEIEQCPNCGAVLLDPGELEQLGGTDQSGVVSFIGDLFSFGKRKEP